MSFETGVFKKYKATRKIHLGFIGDTGMYLSPDEIVEYDGTTLRIGNQSYPATNLRGAILSDDRWLIPLDEVFEPQKYVAQHRFGMVSEEDKDMGKFSDVREIRPNFKHPTKNAYEVSEKMGIQAESDDLSSLLPDAENTGRHYPPPHSTRSDGKTSIQRPVARPQVQPQQAPRQVATTTSSPVKSSAPSSVESVGFVDD